MIERDGSRQSLWQEMPAYSAREKKGIHKSFDVVIVGGGMTGISAGVMLQRAGVKCAVVESRTLGFGTTGGTTAHINTLLDTPYSTIAQNFGKENASRVCESVKGAVEWIRSNISAANIDCNYENASAFLFSENEKEDEELRAIVDATASAGLDIKLVKEFDFPFPFTLAAEAKDQGKFHPIKYLYGLAREFEELGGAIYQHCRVTQVSDERERTNVTTSCGDFSAGSVVYATHIPPGVNVLHLKNTPWRSYAMAVTLKGEYPEGLAYDMKDPYYYYRSQQIGMQTYLIAGGKDHLTGHEDNTAARLRELEAHIRKHFRIDEVIHSWSSQYYESADGLPYIGRHPGANKNLYVSTGYGGNGMIYSAVAARVLTDLIQEKQTIEAELYSPSRIKPIASFKNMAAHNGDTVKQFVGQFFTGESLNEFAQLAEGEGQIVRYDKRHIGLSRDYNGKLYAVNPTCPHLGCSVKWNLAEQSWDCPCHGARYDREGKLLNAPSEHNLESISLQNLSEHSPQKQLLKND